MVGYSGRLSLWGCDGVNNITCTEWAQRDKVGAQDAGGRRQERHRVGSQAEQSALMLQYWCLGSCWLRGPSGDNSRDQRGHGTGRGGGDGMGSDKNVACLCLCSLPFFPQGESHKFMVHI